MLVCSKVHDRGFVAGKSMSAKHRGLGVQVNTATAVTALAAYAGKYRR